MGLKLIFPLDKYTYRLLLNLFQISWSGTYVYYTQIPYDNFISEGKSISISLYVSLYVFMSVCLSVFLSVSLSLNIYIYVSNRTDFLVP